MMTVTVQYKDLEIQLETQIQDDLVIAFDKRRLQQVLLNLLSNAIKYQKTGSICVSLAGIPNNRDDSLLLELEVAD